MRWRVEEAAVARDPRGLYLLAEIRIHVANAKGVRLFDATTRRLKAAPLQ